MGLQTLQQQKKLNVELNTDEIISILEAQLINFSDDFISIEQDNNQINILWFNNINSLENQLKEQEILKNFLNFETFVLIYNKIRNWGLENGL